MKIVIQRFSRSLNKILHLNSRNFNSRILYGVEKSKKAKIFLRISIQVFLLKFCYRTFKIQNGVINMSVEDSKKAQIMLKIDLRSFRCCWSRSCYQTFEIQNGGCNMEVKNLINAQVFLEIGIQGFSRSIITFSCSWSFIGCRYYRLRCAKCMRIVNIYIFVFSDWIRFSY